MQITKIIIDSILSNKIKVLSNIKNLIYTVLDYRKLYY